MSGLRRVGSGKIRILFTIVGLFILWMLLSGFFKPLLVSFGVISSLLSVWIVHRLGFLDGDRHFFQEVRFFSFIRYLIWLTVEIGKADWKVTKVILSNEAPKNQRLMLVEATQASELGKAFFANSITITPGTVTVETAENEFLVHALTDEAADLYALGDMNRRVCNMEAPGN